MRTLWPLAAVIVAAALISGCGESTAKRTVDAQTEALRFYDADTPLLALIDTPHDVGISGAGLASLSVLQPWGPLLRQTERRLDAAGIPPASLGGLIRSSEPVEGLPASQMAVELTRPDDSLTVLVTDAPDEMDQMFEAAVRKGKLSETGVLDDAHLYEGQNGAFAVRDGVMLAAASTARLRAAIQTRDGDQDNHLDDRNVQSLLEEVPEQAPLDVYAKPPANRQGAIRDAIFAVSGAPYGLRIDAFAHLVEQDDRAALPAWGLVTRMPTQQATARIDGDELHATLRVPR